MVCFAVERHGDASPGAVIVTYIDTLIRMNTKAESGDWPRINLEWIICDDDDDQEPQAVLAFQGKALATIAQRWETSEEKAREVIADALLQSINEQYEMSCPA
jgi:hypothetical protein